MRPASADMLLRLLAEVVNLLLQGELLESVRRTFVVRQSWPYASPLGPSGPSPLGSLCVATRSRSTSSRTTHALSWNLSNSAFRHPMVARPRSTSPASGFTDTVQGSSLCGHFYCVQHGASFSGLASSPHAFAIALALGGLLLPT